MTNDTVTVTKGYRGEMGMPELHKRGCGHQRRLASAEDIEIPAPVEWAVNGFVAPAGSKDAYIVSWTRYAFYEDAPEKGELASGHIAPCLGKGQQTIG